MSKGQPVSPAERNWQAEDDHRTLLRAEEIRGDRRRMGAALSHTRRQVQSMGKLLATRTPRRGRR